MTEKKQEFKTVYEVLSHIQKNIKAPKNQHNKFGGYNYRSCEDILQGLKEVMPEGASVTIQDDIFYLEPRFYIKATATLAYSGETISTTAYAREADTKKGMDDSQVTGAASSYARKYALNALFMIDDTKDADATEKHDKSESPAPASPENREWLAKRGGEIKGALQSAKTIKTLETIWNAQANDLQKIKDISKAAYGALDKIYLEKLAELEAQSANS